MSDARRLETGCIGCFDKQAEINRLTALYQSSEHMITALDAERNRLRAALAIMWHAYDTDNRPPHNIVKLAKECYDAGKPALTNEQYVPKGDPRLDTVIRGRPPLANEQKP